MRVIFTGDRNWNCPVLAIDVLGRLLDRNPTGITVVHGAAAGVDTAIDGAAKALRLSGQPVRVEAYAADWNQHGKRAGPLRNAEMIEAGADMVIAMHRAIAASKGTKDCVRQALAMGIEVYLIEEAGGDPVRTREGDWRLGK